MGKVYEYNFDESDSINKDTLGIQYSDVTYLALTLKGFGYTDDEVYTIMSMILNLNISSENAGVKKIDSITKGVLELTDHGDAEEFIEILEMMGRKR